MVTPGLVVGRYELLARIAVGGMGEVYVARLATGDFEKRFAVKLLLPHLSDEADFLKMFSDEARITARLDHPNITHISDFGKANGQFFIAMTLVEGVSLSQLIKAAKREGVQLPLPVVRAVAVGLCEALHYAHTLMGPTGEDLRVVHRDVSPSNLLVSRTGGVLLNDFGIAKAKGKDYRTATGAVRGKLQYMPLEQLHGQPVDSRADVYSAALTIYEALTLVSPFRRDTEVLIADAVQNETVTDPRTLRPEVSDQSAAALLKATARAPDARHQTAQQLLTDFLDGPVALPSEIGALVDRLCKADLEVFRRGSESAAAQQVATKATAGLAPEPELKVMPRRRSAWPWVVLGVMLVGAVSAVGWLFKPPPVVIEAPRPVEVARAPDPKPVEPEPVRPAPPPAVVTKKKEPVVVPKAAPKPAGTGFLTVDATPWAAVSVDGKEIDRTPLARFPLPAGKHVVLLRNPELGKTQQRDVEISEGQATVVQVDLR